MKDIRSENMGSKGTLLFEWHFEIIKIGLYRTFSTDYFSVIFSTLCMEQAKIYREPKFGRDRAFGGWTIGKLKSVKCQILARLNMGVKGAFSLVDLGWMWTEIGLVSDLLVAFTLDWSSSVSSIYIWSEIFGSSSEAKSVNSLSIYIWNANSQS